MKRILAGLVLLGALQAAPAMAGAPYYGPMKPWLGIGYKFGYKETVEPDGSWRIETATRFSEAVDLAMYRAAELARQQGYAYIELLGGKGTSSPGHNTAKLYARPSRSPAAPASCPQKRPTACYTADVAELLRILGGPGGSQPGVPVADHRDQYGREVTISGYGIARASLAPRPTAAVPVPAPATTVAVTRSVEPVPSSLTTAARFEAARRELSPH